MESQTISWRRSTRLWTRASLPAWLERSGFGHLIGGIDFDAVRADLDSVEEAVSQCLPGNYVLVPNFGIQRTDWSTDESAFHQ